MAIKVPETKEIVPSVLSNLLNWGTDSASWPWLRAQLPVLLPDETPSGGTGPSGKWASPLVLRGVVFLALASTFSGQGPITFQYFYDDLNQLVNVVDSSAPAVLAARGRRFPRHVCTRFAWTRCRACRRARACTRSATPMHPRLWTWRIPGGRIGSLGPLLGPRNSRHLLTRDPTRLRAGVQTASLFRSLPGSNALC
jgi:hypothetical protein